MRAPFEVRGVRAAGVMLHFVLEGQVRPSRGGEALDLGRGAGEPVRMVMSAANDPMAFRRCGSAGDRVRGVNVEMSHAWLRENGLGALADGTEPSLRRNCGSVHPEDVRMLERLIRLMPEDTPLARLEVEALALRLICSTCAQFAGRAGCRAGMSRDDSRKLERMEQFIEAGQGDLSELSEISRIGNVSLSKMRRMFCAAHGCSVQHYVRDTRPCLPRTGRGDSGRGRAACELPLTCQFFDGVSEGDGVCSVTPFKVEGPNPAVLSLIKSLP
ncbi:hypothetical protein [Tropicimonas aquimaris]|uniref:HTH araC/xylS-type domain-containing protein n=1 Tax=Tropicimonas aquimaris TaxID=914152 RepID=A0ABW3IY48_9RHOB